MTPRRLIVGSFVLLAACCYCWFRSTSQSIHAHPGDPALVSASDAYTSDGNHDDQEHRYRNSQCRHWKHVMLGTR
jgi:hypothetical protein